MLQSVNTNRTQRHPLMAERLRRSWWRRALLLTVLFSLVILVVTPSTVDVAGAGPHFSTISSGGIDFGDDLDDNFDVMLVAAIADGPPDPSRPLPVCPERSGCAQSISTYHPPDRAPPAEDSPLHIHASTASHRVVPLSQHHRSNAITSIDNPSLGHARPPISALARTVRSCASTFEESALTARRERNAPWLS